MDCSRFYTYVSEPHGLGPTAVLWVLEVTCWLPAGSLQAPWSPATRQQRSDQDLPDRAFRRQARGSADGSYGRTESIREEVGVRQCNRLGSEGSAAPSPCLTGLGARLQCLSWEVQSESHQLLLLLFFFCSPETMAELVSSCN